MLGLRASRVAITPHQTRSAPAGRSARFLSTTSGFSSRRTVTARTATTAMSVRRRRPACRSQTWAATPARSSPPQRRFSCLRARLGRPGATSPVARASASRGSSRTCRAISATCSGSTSRVGAPEAANAPVRASSTPSRSYWAPSAVFSSPVRIRASTQTRASKMVTASVTRASVSGRVRGAAKRCLVTVATSSRPSSRKAVRLSPPLPPATLCVARRGPRAPTGTGAARAAGDRTRRQNAGSAVTAR